MIYYALVSKEFEAGAFLRIPSCTLDEITESRGKQMKQELDFKIQEIAGRIRELRELENKTPEEMSRIYRELDVL